MWSASLGVRAETRETLTMTSFTVSLLCMAGIIGLVRGQNGIVIVGETTASPTVTQMATSAPDLLLTAAEVIAQGGAVLYKIQTRSLVNRLTFAVALR